MPNSPASRIPIGHSSGGIGGSFVKSRIASSWPQGVQMWVALSVRESAGSEKTYVASVVLP
jgi:hypothetical protein